jgi:hypothetical protein
MSKIEHVIQIQDECGWLEVADDPDESDATEIRYVDEDGSVCESVMVFNEQLPMMIAALQERLLVVMTRQGRSKITIPTINFSSDRDYVDYESESLMPTMTPAVGPKKTGEEN